MMEEKCSHMGCNQKATRIVNANDGTKNKYLACDEHKNKLNIITMQGNKVKG